ncbi:hypothetical protein [Jiangella asiatica]|uniref:Uncharacterized protein n=1 Tax=Jiangella asiatica TaxID=2530372 RepID=A0A4R5D473_9ACTN|nr:hypothetical protein [Jiangella asiatica]TDE08202.1 hypothetical protein E1269_17995 [Jiangella asiatica]
MDEFWGMSATAWTAIYTMITFGLLVGAGVAAWYAKEQWAIARDQAADTRKAQLEASRPYVVVTVEPSAASRRLFDLVVKNIGQRPAMDVSIKLDPPPIRAKETPGHEIANAKMLNTPVAMIAPGQEMRAFYDSHLDRNGRDDLPTSHQVSLAYRDSSQNSYTETSVLDIEAMTGVMFVDVKTVHDIAKILDKIANTLRSASILQRSGSVDVDAAIETRDEQQQRFADERVERERQQREFMERLRPTPPADAEGATSDDSTSPEDPSQ